MRLIPQRGSEKWMITRPVSLENPLYSTISHDGRYQPVIQEVRGAREIPAGMYPGKLHWQFRSLPEFGKGYDERDFRIDNGISVSGS